MTLPGYDYVEEVLRGRVVVGRLVRLACERAKKDLKRWGTDAGGAHWFDAGAATHAIEFVEKFCRHSKGEWAGRPVELAPWQRFIVAQIFGWKRRGGTRRFRKAYVEVARKNGKSTLMAAVGLYMLVSDGEPGADVYACATKREQAQIIWGEADRMVKASTPLLKRVRPFRNSLAVAATSSKFEPLSSDSKTLDGLNVHCGLIDELHAHPSRDVYDVIDTATGARRQPLIFSITTAGFDKQSICWEEHEYGRKIVETHHADETFFAYVAAIDDGDKWTNPKVWEKANPNLGVSVKPDDLKRKSDKAKRVPAQQNAFRRLHCNEWTEQESRWIDLEAWDACGGPVDEDELRGRRCFIGLDLASNSDIAAAIALFPPDDDDSLWRLLCRFWIPEDNIAARVQNDRVPYNVWAEQQHLTTTPGNVIDYAFIREELLEMFDTFEVVECAYDPWGATQISTELQEAGLTMVPLRQTLAVLAPATKEFERLVLAVLLAHGGNPVLRWMVGNVAIRQGPDETRKPDKQKSKERIDGVSAAVMALARAVLSGQGGGSVYEERGLLEVDA